MSHGVANTVTLYDAAGNAVQVSLQDGEYRLVSSDTRTHDTLDEIKVVLAEIRDILNLLGTQL